jgi:hypothetical protein
VLSGDRDTRTPTAGGIEVASRFTHAHVTVVPGVGHSVLGADLSGCAQSSVIGWLQGRTPPTTCPPSPPLLPVMGPFYKTLNAAPVVGKIGGKIGHTLGAVVSTLDDAADTYLFEQLGISSTAQPGLIARQGLEGGLLTSFGSVGTFARKFTMQGYSDIPGVELNGTLSIFPGGLPLQFQGKLTVTGDKAANGTLVLNASAIAGKLGGRRVAGTTGHKGFFGPGVTAFARHLAG